MIRRPTDAEAVLQDPNIGKVLPGGVSVNIQTNKRMFTLYLIQYMAFSLFCGIVSLYSGLAIKLAWTFLTIATITFWFIVRMLYSYGVERAVVRLVDMTNLGVVAGGVFGIIMVVSYQDIAVYMGIMAHIFFYFVYICSLFGLLMHRLAYDPYSTRGSKKPFPRTV